MITIIIHRRSHWLGQEPADEKDYAEQDVYRVIHRGEFELAWNKTEKARIRPVGCADTGDGMLLVASKQESDHAEQ